MLWGIGQVLVLSKRPNFKTMSAFQQRLERAGLIDDDYKVLGEAYSNAGFRDLFFALGGPIETPEQFKCIAKLLTSTKNDFEKAYKVLKDVTFMNPGVFLTTGSNTADTELTQPVPYRSRKPE